MFYCICMTKFFGLTPSPHLCASMMDGYCNFPHLKFSCLFVVDERLLVGIGVTSVGLTDQMEMIDLNNPDSYWTDFERFPVKLNNPIVGKSPGGSPIICGENMFFIHNNI
jgi:hypothetical protein